MMIPMTRMLMMSNVAVVLSVALFSNTFPHLPCYSDDADDGTTSRLHGVGKMHQPRLDKNDTIKSRPKEGRVPQQEYAVVTLPDKINPATPKSSNSYAACIERGCMQDRRRRIETDLLKPTERWLLIDLSFIPSTSKQSKSNDAFLLLWWFTHLYSSWLLHQILFFYFFSFLGDLWSERRMRVSMRVCKSWFPLSPLPPPMFHFYELLLVVWWNCANL